MSITGIIFFGDSVLAGTGASERELGCSKLVKDALTIPVSLKARNWNTSWDGLDRLEADVLKQSAFSHVVILFGNNDCWLQAPDQPKIPLEFFSENIIKMAKRIKNNGQTPILCTLQPIDVPRFTMQFQELLEFQKKSQKNILQFQQMYSAKIQQLAIAGEILFIDIRSPLEKCPEDTIAIDGIHPNDRGHRLIAQTFLKNFKQWDNSLMIPNQLQDSIA